MPAEAKGPRLWFKRGNKGKEGRRLNGYWIIKDDGNVRRSTGVRSARGGKPPQAALDALAAYILEKREVPREKGRDADSVPVADVINIYTADCAQRQAREKEVLQRARKLLEFWGDKTLNQVTGKTCRAYVEHRQKRAAARRELEDLRAAINHHRSEGLCRHVVEVVLPEAGLPRERILTRSEAARLIWAAWRYREVQKGKPTGRRSRQHVARFVLVGLYTGTRSGAVCAAQFGLSSTRAWVDLEKGRLHRKGSAERETKKRRPPVKLPTRLLAHMRRWHKNGQRYVIEWNGDPITTGLEKAFRRACEAARLEGVTPHTLRHTAATWSMERGTPIEKASDFLGMSMETLRRVYWHHHPDFQQEAADNIVRKA